MFRVIVEFESRVSEMECPDLGEVRGSECESSSIERQREGERGRDIPRHSACKWINAL